MAIDKTWDISVSYEITSDNEEWREQMETGMPAPKVTGGSINLPQGGTRPSKAAVIGGIFEEGSESATYAEQNSRNILDTILPQEIQNKISNLLENGNDLKDIEFFSSNIVKSEYNKIAGEFSDNVDEAAATDTVINSISVKIIIDGLPTKEEVTQYAKESFIEFVQKTLGSDIS